MASIFLCFLLYYNFILLGEFFFVTVAAGVTSFWLRQVKGIIVSLVEQSFNSSFYFIQTSTVYKILSMFLIPLLKQRNPCKLLEEARCQYKKTVDHRTKANKTIFNTEQDVCLIFLAYIGFSKFSWRFTLLAWMNLSLVYLALMIFLDLVILGLKLSGLAYYAIIDTRDMKLQRHQMPRINMTIMVVFVVAFPAIATLLTKLILIDLTQLQSIIVRLLSKIDPTAIPG